MLIVKAEDIERVHVNKGCIPSCPCQHAVIIHLKTSLTPVRLERMFGNDIARLLKIVGPSKTFGVKIQHFASVQDDGGQTRTKHMQKVPIVCGDVEIQYPRMHFYTDFVIFRNKNLDQYMRPKN